MSDPDPGNLPQPPSRRLRTPFWAMWGRETVKDLTLVLAAIPVLCTLIYVPAVATSSGSWTRLLVLLAVLCGLWWVLRILLRRWVAAGDRGEDPPSRG